nr:hypothetical protein GCM10020092_050190 [Actinoplanes digitatis]
MTPVSSDRSATAEDLRPLFGESSVVFASLVDPEHLVTTANPAFFAAIGARPGVPGARLADLAPELADQGLITRLDQVFRAADPDTGRYARVVLGEASFDFTYEPRRDAGW